MLEIVLASQNSSKLAEMQELLRDLEIKFIPQTEFSVPDIEETGSTFVENAIIKARHAVKQTGLPALADDSGLTIAALNSAPGVFSSRYAGKNATDAERIQKVLEALEAADDSDRSASFHCVIALMENENDPAPLICHGVWEGEIAREPRGKNGFGYDPIFYVPSHQRTAAELDPQEKNAISHRGQALEQLSTVLTEAFLV
ncbi:XTP/dITP diphosphatase [Coxiella burnetii]|uniref:XTP/dITP diphosphatase n=1 Tax=Coxiella burnetii TaxID=777 RepID=UPI00039ECF92|nr:XTP/dITP diphosphatase [Coxiella burnetii]